MNDLTLIVPYYRQPAMLLLQASVWEKYPPCIRVVVVDDGSPVDPAAEVIQTFSRAQFLRVLVDVPWNRNGARNLGTQFATSDWVLHTDIDHVLHERDAWALAKQGLDPHRWYRFTRYRVGRADETRKKDDLPPDQDFGPIKPHVDSFVCTRDAYWKAGGYDEDYSGSLGGSAPFLGHMTREHGEARLLPIALHVHTRHSVPDASESHLSRSRERYEALRAWKKAHGDPKPISHVRFAWERVR